MLSQPRGGAPLDSSDLANMGVELVQEYEAFTLGRVPVARLEHAKATAGQRGIGIIVADQWDLVQMPGFTVDTRTPRLPDSGVLAAYPDGRGLYVIHFAGPLRPEWKTALDDAGLAYVSYLPHNAALVFAAQADVDAMRQHSFVQWTSIYHPSFRSRPKHYPVTAEPRTYVVQLANTPGNDRVLGHLQRISRAPVSTWAYGPYLNARVETLPLQMATLGEDPFVIAIEEPGTVAVSGEREAIAATALQQVYAGEVYQNRAQPIKATSDYRQWLSNRGVLDTSAYRIAFADTGLDIAPANMRPAHPDLNRSDIVQLPSYIGRSNTGDSSGHGTAVAGIAVGDPTATPPANMTQHIENGFYRGMGVAPKTGIIVQQVLSDGTVTSSSIATIAHDALNSDAAVQTHSNNTYSTNGQYTLEAQAYDYAVRDTSTATRTQLPMTVSAGNIGEYGDNTTVVLSPATAKNVISVGGVESYGTGVSGCTGSVIRGPKDLIAGGFRNVAGHSRRGTADGRIKPDILAPSTMVNATRTQYQPSSVYNAGGGCVETSDKFYTVDSGTSFAAPQVAAAAVLFDRYKNAKLSPAMLKAALIGNALSVKGGTDRYSGTTLAARPNTVQGFGRLYLGDAFDPAMKQLYFEEGSLATFTGAGQLSASRVINVVDRTKPAVVVLAWTDEPAGVNANPTLVRDLDLSLRYMGTACTSFVGNSMTTNEASFDYAPGCSVPSAAYDRKNNVEMIVIPANYYYANFYLEIRAVTWGFGAANQKFAVYASNAQ